MRVRFDRNDKSFATFTRDTSQDKYQLAIGIKYHKTATYKIPRSIIFF